MTFRNGLSNVRQYQIFENSINVQKEDGKREKHTYTHTGYVISCYLS